MRCGERLTISMGVVFLIVFGATLGLIAALLGDGAGARFFLTYVAVGIGAALLSGLLLPLAFGLPGMSDDSRIDAASVGTACLGSMILLTAAILSMRQPKR